MRTLTTIFFLIVYPACELASADTHIYGPITDNQLWTAENSPYIIHGSVWLEPSVELTVTQGVIVKFEPGVNNGSSLNCVGETGRPDPAMPALCFC